MSFSPSLIIGIISLIVSLSSPFLLKLGIHYFYTPGIDISIPRVDGRIAWHELGDVGESPHRRINIHNQSGRELTIEIVFELDKEWDYRSEKINRLYLTDFRVEDGEFRYTHRLTEWQDREIVLSPGRNSNWGFPLEPKREEAILKVVVYPEVQMTEFGLPPGLGSVELQPVEKQYRVLA